MQVLEKGRPQKGWAVETICTGKGNGDGGCGAKLLVEEGDVFKTHSSARDESTYYITFKCPECGVKTDLDNSDNYSGHVPDHVWDNAPSKFGGSGR